MTVGMILIVLAVLMAIGLPVSIAVLVPSLLYLFINDIPLSSAIARMSGSVNSFTVMAVPFFIIAGQVMNNSGLTEKLIAFTRCLVGHMRGGLAQVNVAASIIFAGMSGSAVADAGGLGSVLIGPMKKDGYTGSFAAAVTAASSTIGPIIPPSIPMVIFAVIAEESVGRLFLAGAVPGFLLGLLMMVMLRFMPQTRDVKVYPRATLTEFRTHLPAGLLALMMPAIILIGITAGVFTPTEAAAVAAVYATIVGAFILRGLTMKRFRGALLQSMLLSGNVLFVVAVAGVFGWILAREGVSGQLANWLIEMDLSPLMLLIALNVLLLLIGCVLEPISVLIVLTPVLVPVIGYAGIDTVHFGVIMVFNLMIGLVTPPMGLVLYVVGDVTGEKFEHVVKDILPFYLPMLLVLLLITAFPNLVLWLPDLVFN
jgi:tripartite ATP-independent transporter DctM subunit